MNVVTAFFKNRYKEYLLNRLSKLRPKVSNYGRLAAFCNSALATEYDFMQNYLSAYRLNPQDAYYLSEYNRHSESYYTYKSQYDFYFSKYKFYSSQVDKLEEKLNNL